jgi:sarcosine oxidase, subunit beta
LASDPYHVAIVGGGVIGWSVAWHLLARQPTLKVIVVDPSQTRCTSLRGAGGSRAQFSTDVNIALSLLSIEEFKRFRQDVGSDIAYQQNGYLLCTADLDRAHKMVEAAKHQAERGVEIQSLTPDELKERVSCLNASDVVHAQIGMQDGYMDGPSVQRGYRSAALQLGAVELCANAIGVSASQVESHAETVTAEHVVVATGHWSGEMGLDLPVQPEKHQLFFDRPPKVNPSWPFTIDADTTFHFRPSDEGILVCYNDPQLSSGTYQADEAPLFDDSVLDRLIPIAEHRAPGFLELNRIERGRAGFYAVTPDRHPILGRHQGIYVATGFGGHGVMHSPAAGKLVAEMLLDGEATSVDISSLDPGRFAKGQLIEETMVF